ncbi:MAG: hypothetical protein C0604_06480, partial [Clostridiales bacterium]
MNRQKLLEVFGQRPGRLETLEKLVRQLGGNESSNVLEGGCGTGEGIAHLCKNIGCKGTGIDFDAMVLSKAEEKNNHENLTFTEGSVYGIDCEGNSFDFVISEAAFSLLPNKQKAADEFYRILKKGGRLLLRDFVSIEQVNEKDRDDIRHIPCFNGIGTIEEYETVFRNAGFEIQMKEISTKEIIKTALYLSREFKVKPSEISHLFASIMNAGGEMGDRGKCFFDGNRIGFA